MKADPKSSWTSINPPVCESVLYGAQVSQRRLSLPRLSDQAVVTTFSPGRISVSPQRLFISQCFSFTWSGAAEGLLTVAPIAHCFCSRQAQPTPPDRTESLSPHPSPVRGAPPCAYCKRSEELPSSSPACPSDLPAVAAEPPPTGRPPVCFYVTGCTLALVLGHLNMAGF